MIDRRKFVRATITGLLIVPSVACSQASKTYRIAYLWQGSQSDTAVTGNSLPILLKNLRELGYVEGQNLTVDARLAEGRQEDLLRLDAEIVKPTHKRSLFRARESRKPSSDTPRRFRWWLCQPDRSNTGRR